MVSRIERILGHLSTGPVKIRQPDEHLTQATKDESTLTTHVLDTSTGKPAEGLYVGLFAVHENTYKEVDVQVTDPDGRVKGFPRLCAGVYRLTFRTAEYFRARGQDSFYPAVRVDFNVAPGKHSESAHYHVPLILSPYGYTTYRGS